MCRGTDGAARLQDLHVDVVLNLLQPSLWVHRHEERNCWGSPKRARATPVPQHPEAKPPRGQQSPACACCSLHGWSRACSHLRYRRLPSNISAALRSGVTHQQSFFAQKP